jgi:hypothetical protein
MSNIVRFPNRPTLKTFAEDLDVSEPTKTALFNYLNKRQCPGNFLTAVLTNNLIETVRAGFNSRGSPQIFLKILRSYTL